MMSRGMTLDKQKGSGACSPGSDRRADHRLWFEPVDLHYLGALPHCVRDVRFDPCHGFHGA